MSKEIEGCGFAAFQIERYKGPRPLALLPINSNLLGIVKQGRVVNFADLLVLRQFLC